MTETHAHLRPRPAALPEPFRAACPVHFDELDPMGILHNARYQVHVERGLTAFLRGRGFEGPPHLPGNADKFHAVRRFEIEFDRPFRDEGVLTVELWLEHLGRTSTRHGFACLGRDGEIHATGSRTVVKLDPADFRPARWSPAWREAHLEGLRHDRSF